MRRIRGPRREVDTPGEAELDWVFSVLQDEAVYLPLSLARAPSREEFDAGALYLVEGEGRGVEALRFHIVRLYETSEPWGFFLEYGWEGAFDTPREFDLVASPSGERSLALLLEAHVIGAQYLFLNGLARRLRWRVKAPENRPPRWYGRLGARHIGAMTEPHPVTGELLSKHVYEMTHGEFNELLKGQGLDPEADFGESGKPVWDLLRR